MNIIQIVSDTLRRDFLGCYGNNWIHTENIDALARESVVFDKAYVASFPTIPHRTDTFTGKYTFTRAGWQPLGRNEITLPQILRQDGYTTMLIVDTYHMIRDAHYFDRGFDGWWWIRGQEFDRYMTNPTDDTIERQKAMGTQYLMNVSQRRFENDYFVAQTMDAAIKWLELNYSKHNKFFLHVDTFDPHEPWDPPRWYVDMYDPGWIGGDVMGGAYLRGFRFRRLASSLTHEELQHLRALYAGEVTLVDRWVGRLLDKIRDLGLFEDTAVIFTTDHGSYHGEHGFLGKNYLDKDQPLYEEVVHIPLIMRMPDSQEISPKRCESLVQPPDLMPTILELAGAKVPDIVEGKSTLPSILGEETKEHEIAISSTGLVPKRGRHTDARTMTITSNEWALIAPRADAVGKEVEERKVEPELYHLHRDPVQANNMYSEKKEVANELYLRMIEFLKSVRTSKEILDLWIRSSV